MRYSVGAWLLAFILAYIAVAVVRGEADDHAHEVTSISPIDILMPGTGEATDQLKE